MIPQNGKTRLFSWDWLLEILSFLIVCTLFFLPIFFIRDLPQEIPVHFNFLGEADRYGNKQNIWAIAIIGLIIYLFTTILNFFPSIFNYPVSITPANSKDHYRLVLRMLRWIKLLTLIGFCYGVFKMTFFNLGLNYYSWLVLPTIVMSIFAVTAFFYMRMMKIK